MGHMRLDVAGPLVVVIGALSLGAACGPDGPDGPAAAVEVEAAAGAAGVVAGPGTDADGDPAAGAALFADRGCAGCHGPDGRGAVGPTLAGIHGTEVDLADGRRVTVDDAYLRRSIELPQADVVAGYTVKMPTLELDSTEIADLVAYIRSLEHTE